MQHLGSEEELHQVLRDIWKTLSPEERLELLSPEERLRGLSPDERMRGLTLEERIKGLAPEELERLRQVLQARMKADNGASQ